MANGFRMITRFVWLSFLGAAAAACLSPPGPVEVIDRSHGLEEQRALITRLFNASDTRQPLDPAVHSTRFSEKAVSAAWWGFDPADSTVFLQAALDSGAETILVPRMAGPWICRALAVRSRTTLILEEGVELLAKPGAFRPRSGAFLNINDVEDVTVSGYGAVIRMRKADYTAPPYEKGEWRHTIQICGGTRVTVRGLTAETSGGDGVYLGRGGTSLTNTAIVLKDLVLKNHHRQAVSVITAVDLLIENTEMSGTSGTAPSAGIDFEPNHPDEPLRGCRLRRCLIRNNAGAGFQGYFRAQTQASPPFDITLEDSTVYGNLAGVFLAGFDKGAHGRLTFTGNRIYGLRFIPPTSQRFLFTER
jgi:hypothetical protein